MIALSLIMIKNFVISIKPLIANVVNVLNKSPNIQKRNVVVYQKLYNNQINACALIGQPAVGYCTGKPTKKPHIF